MEIVPFRDLSDALVPLPALPVQQSDHAAQPNASSDRSFRDELDNRLAAQETESLFDLGSPVSGSSPPAMSSPALRTNLSIPTSENPDELMLACREIEGLLLGMLLKNLGDTDSGSTLFSSTWESSFYQDMFFTEIAKAIGNNPPGLGIAKVLYEDIIMKAGESVDRLA